MAIPAAILALCLRLLMNPCLVIIDESKGRISELVVCEEEDICMGQVIVTL